MQGDPRIGILTHRQRIWAWLGFLATALLAPIAAHAVDDASWLFSLCVAGMVATVIVMDDRSRRPAADQRGN